MCVTWIRMPHSLHLGGCRGTLGGTGDSCPPVAAIGLPTSATLLPPAGRILVVDVDLLLADLLGH